jgi:NADH dehydrogenase (ubiquinone) 1 alpha subcomplex subunit 9
LTCLLIFQEVDVRDGETIRKAVEHSNLVINCIGTNYETRNFNYNDVHVDAPRLIAKIARECGVQKLIHFSALNASPDPQEIFNKSRFLMSKVI